MALSSRGRRRVDASLREAWDGDVERALVTYKAKVTFMYEGKESSGSYNSGSVWRNTKGDWRRVFYTEVKKEKPETTAAQ